MFSIHGPVGYPVMTALFSAIEVVCPGRCMK